jgi:two-component system cell cycle response regulator DivK
MVGGRLKLMSDIKRILYVEDNPQNMRLVRKLLKVNGYDTIEALTGEAGVEAAACEIPDLILMDINLPDIDGLEATRRIKSNPKLANIPIIALTAAAMRGDRERILTAGCDDYLQKPIDTVQMIETVRRHLARIETLSNLWTTND